MPENDRAITPAHRAIAEALDDGHGVPEDEMQAADAVLVALRSLPVEQRMEAMGMVQHDDSCRNDGHGGHWHER